MGKAVPKLTPRFVSDEKGKFSAVLLDLQQYRKLVEYLEEMEDIMDCLKRQSEPAIPYDKFVRKLKKAGRI